jgi:hypothetical protein
MPKPGAVRGSIHPSATFIGSLSSESNIFTPDFAGKYSMKIAFGIAAHSCVWMSQ